MANISGWIAKKICHGLRKKIEVGVVKYFVGEVAKILWDWRG